jgi:pullulanase
MPTSDLLLRKKLNFSLWLPQHTDNPPALVVGTFKPGAPPSITGLKTLPLTLTAPGLWEIEAASCGLADGVYHYWFEVNNAAPGQTQARVRRTDPLGYTIDWRVAAPPVPGTPDPDPNPASVILLRKVGSQTELVACDLGGEVIEWNERPPSQLGLPANNAMVIYELPPRWAQTDGNRLTGVGTFRDVQALVDSTVGAVNFDGIRLLQIGHQYLADLGVNALELLPVADTRDDRQWGYATANYAAPDYDLGFPEAFCWPTANADFARLVQACHAMKMRVFLDVVLGYGRGDPYVSIADALFHFPAADAKTTKYEDADPEQRTSRWGELRQDWGGRLWRYLQTQPGVYDPISGQTADVVPARQFLKIALERWVREFHVDGLRLDSVETVANWDFVAEYRDCGRAVFGERWGTDTGADSHFLVVGEELQVPTALLAQNRLDGLWNENFKKRVRCALLGRNFGDDSSFEDTIRKLIDCRAVGISDGAKAVNYVTSHDVEGKGNERLYHFLENNGVAIKEERFKLAFSCLLTAVGIPMTLAGEEFADQSDLSLSFPQKKFDAVNFDRLQYALDQVAGRIPVDGEHGDQTWRARIYDHVRRLVALRKTHPALGVNDTDFIHVDFNQGKRVLAWRRGDLANPVVVVANFSDWGTDLSQPGAEYRVPNWPATPPGMVWFEVTRGELVSDPRWVGAWALLPWQATVWRLQPA